MFYSKSNKNIFNCLLAVVFAFYSCGAHSQSQNPNQISKLMKKYNSTLFYVDKFYVDTVNLEQIVEKSIVNTVQSLDPHSNYISKEEYKAMNEPLEGNFEGIGVEFNILEDTLIVVTPLVGGPSEKLGVHSRDRIIQIDGKDITNIGLTNEKVHSLLRGPKGSKVIATIKRGNEIIDFNIIRDKIPINSVEAAYEPEKGIAYIKLSRFAKTSMEEIIDALGKFKKPHSMILDLRSNGGGIMGAAIGLADQFLDKGKLIVYTEGLHSPRYQAIATEGGRFLTGNLVVLINEGSASASEIVSGAIQDWDRGIIIGRRSFGKGLVQQDFPLEDGSALRMTVSRYYTPSGRAIQSPYENGKKDKYYTDFYSRRYSEMFNTDSIRFDDALKYSTLLNNRTVYGGGGIMPDIYMPVDTSDYSKYSGEILHKGILSQFVSSYMDKNGDELRKQYPTFEKFQKSFAVTGIFDKMVDYAEKEGVKRSEEGIKTSGNYLRSYIKALIARQLFGYSSFYSVINETDREFMKALEVLKDWKTYSKKYLKTK